MDNTSEYYCPRCAGMGWLSHDAHCPDCDGTGKVDEDHPDPFFVGADLLYELEKDRRLDS